MLREHIYQHIGMDFAPAAIVFVNDDLVPATLAWFQTQLKIDYTYDGYVFDDIIAYDSSYPAAVKANDARVLVVGESVNRSLADLVLFYKAGMVSVACNKFGQPGRTFPLRNLNFGQLGIHQKSYVKNGCCGPKKCLKSYETRCGCCSSCGGCKKKCTACSSCSCGLALIPISKRV